MAVDFAGIDSVAFILREDFFVWWCCFQEVIIAKGHNRATGVGVLQAAVICVGTPDVYSYVHKFFTLHVLHK